MGNMGKKVYTKNVWKRTVYECLCKCKKPPGQNGGLCMFDIKWDLDIVGIKETWWNEENQLDTVIS